MKDLLDYIVKSLVSKPENAVINEDYTEGIVNINLTVDPEDMGIIIGKAGQTIRSIRKLLISRAMAEGRDTRVNLILTEVK